MSAPCGPAEQEVITESFRMANLSPLVPWCDFGSQSGNGKKKVFKYVFILGDLDGLAIFGWFLWSFSGVWPFVLPGCWALASPKRFFGRIPDLTTPDDLSVG